MAPEYFINLSFLSLFLTICWAKMSLLLLVSEGGLHNLCVFLLSIIWSMGKLNAILVFGYEHWKLGRLLRAMDKYEELCPNIGPHSPTKRKLEYAHGLAFGTTIVALIWEFDRIRDLGFGKHLLASSHKFSKYLFMWSWKNMEEQSAKLEVDFGSALTVITVVMGLVIFGLEIFSLLQTGFAIDCVTLTALIAHTDVVELMKDIEEFNVNVSRRRRARIEEWKRNPEKSVAFWRKYKMIQEIIQASNDAFDPFFKQVYGVNIMIPPFILTLSLEGFSLYHILILAVNVIKVTLWYIHAGKISEQNEKLCTWIRTCAIPMGTVRVDGVEVDPRVILKELEEKPLGLGLGLTRMHETIYYVLLLPVAWIFDLVFKG